MGLYDDIDNEVLDGKTNTNNNASVGLFDEIDNEVLNAPQEPSFMDNLKGFGDKVLRKGKSVISNLNTSNPYENAIINAPETVQPIQPAQQPIENLPTSTIEDRINSPLLSIQRNNQPINDNQTMLLKGGIREDVDLGNIGEIKPISRLESLASQLRAKKQFSDAEYQRLKNEYDKMIAEKEANSWTNKIDLRPATYLNNTIGGIGGVMSDVLPYAMGGYYDDIKGLGKDSLEAFKRGWQNTEAMRGNSRLLDNVEFMQNLAMYFGTLGKSGALFRTLPSEAQTFAISKFLQQNPALARSIIAGYASGALNSLAEKGVSSDLPIDANKEAVALALYDIGFSALRGLARTRLNPKNYEKVIVSDKPVRKGVGLSQREVYEPRTTFEYKRDWNAKDGTYKPKITSNGTGFTMGESGELKTPERPVKKKYDVSTNVQYTPNFTIERVAPSVFAKQQAKTEAKEEARQEQMENLAPNTMAEQKAKAEVKEAQKEAEKRGHHTKDFNKGDIVRDIYRGHIYEVIEPDKRGMGHLRNVDTDEIETLNAHNNAHFEKYEYNPDDLIEVKEFKYDPKENKRANSDLKTQQDYMYSKQEVVDAYNEYVKNPTEANREKYEDVSGEALKEFHDNEEAIKNGTFKPNVETTEKVNTNDVAGTLGNANNVEPKTQKKKTKKQEIKEKCDKATNLTNNELKKYIPDEQRSVILENLKKSAEKEHFADLMFKLKEKIDNAPGLYETDGDKNAKPILKYFAGNIDAYIFEIDKETGEMFGIGSMGHEYEAGYYTPDTFNSLKSSIKSSGDGTLSVSPAFELDLYSDLNVTKEDLLNGTLEKSEKIVNNEDIDNNSEVSDDNIRTSASGSKGLSQELSPTLRGVHSDKPHDGRSDSGRHSEIRSEDKFEHSSSDLGTVSSTIAEHKEIIEKSYRSQHELNNAIENFINNKEYEVYNGNLPDEVKSFLKKYAGAGGLEKQGAEGKGLLSEYYTPDNVVKKMWDLTSQYINPDGAKVLEPSVGIGRFLEHAPKGTSFDVVEMNPVSAKITELLYPDANVTVGQFQERFIDKSKNLPIKEVTPEYDIVIGNPPYGEYSGMYKGLGEGKKYKTLQAYFINRGLDTLKENGVMTFIVPSSFLENINDKLEISGKAELLDAYRLPEKTFDTTSIGTDIIVMRKRTGQGQDTNFVAEQWFKKHPEKILGTQETRKNRFGKEEMYVKGDKNAVEKIRTTEKDIKKTVDTKTAKTDKVIVEKSKKTNTNKKVKDTTEKVKKENIDYEVYQPKNTVSDEEKALYRDTRVDGTLPEDKYSPSEKVNQYKGKLYNDFNYLQGNLYDKLDALETENISDKQKEIQRKKINDVLPAKISISKMEVSPTSDFISDLDIKVENPQYSEYYYGRRKKDNIALRDEKEINLVQGAIQYINSNLVQKDDLKTKTGNTANITRANITKYLQGNTHFDYDRAFKADDQCTPAEKKEKESYKTQVKSDLREVANKLFVEYLTTLPEETQKIIQDAYNREFNGYIVPDYLKMPFLVDDVSSTFTNGKPLEFRKEQIEGINFLLNKGVGLLGFDTGVGKTLTSIVASYQNMKNGYCKRPLMIVQSANQKKWQEEIKALYPNVKVNFLDNLGAKSTFNGEIEDNSITLVPYESLDNIWYNKETLEELETILGDMKVQETSGKLAYQEEMRRAGKRVKGDTERQKEKFKEDIRKMLGIALKGNSNKFKFEDLGFDYITVDEAQNFNNIFTSAKAYNEKGGFNLGQTKDPTQRAVRLFMMTQYVLSHNSNRNVCLLSATPFTNNPTQIFSIFSLIGKDLLDNMHCYNVHQFMETFADMKAVDEIDHKNEIVTREECRGFKNKKVLYQIRDSLMMMRKGKEEDLDRPNRITIKPTLYPTAQQANILKNVDEYLSTASSEGGRNNARTLQEINIARKATLSPHFAMGNIAETSADTVVKSSPKLEYTCNCIGEQYKADKHSRQIVFMPMGNELFPKMKEYIAKHYDIKENEIATIDGETKSDLIQEYITEFKKLDGKIKVIFGTKTIKEGLDLQDFTTTLYLPLNDWNPTDHKQVVGRFWRHGNNYENIRTVIPLLFDSSDSFQMQKLDNKIKRINDMHYSNTEGEFIDESELEAEDSALDLIANPEKKTNAFKKYKTRELENKKKALIDRKEAVERYIDSKKSKENTIEYYEKENEKLKQEIKEMEENFPKDENGKIIKPSNDWSYNSKVSRLESNKKYYKNAKEELKILESIAKKREYEVNGADSPEVLSNKIAEIEEQVTNLEEIVSKKREEYNKFYEETKAQAKGVKELVDDYIKQTKELYDGFDVVKDGKFTKKKSKELLKSENDIDKLKRYNNKNNYIGNNDEHRFFFKRDAKANDVLTTLNECKNHNSYRLVKDYFEGYEHIKIAKADDDILKKYGANAYYIGDTIYVKEDFEIPDIIHELAHIKDEMANVDNRIMDLEDWIYDAIINIPENHEILTKVKDFLYNNTSSEKFANHNEQVAINRLNGGTNESFKQPTRRTKTFIHQIAELVKRRRDNKHRFRLNRKNGQTSQETEGSGKTIAEKNSKILASQDEIKIEKATRDSLYQWYGEVEKARYDVDKDLNQFNKITRSTAKDFSNKTGMKVSDKMIREILPFLRERTEVPEALGRKDLTEFYNKLDKNDIARLTKLADDVCGKFDKYWQNYKDAKGILTEEDIENHISHLWKTDKKQKGVLTNYFNTNSRFAKPRTIETLVKGIEQGLEPRTLDIGEILKIQSDSLIKSANDSILAETLKKMRFGKEILLQPSHKAPADWIEIDHPALNKAVYTGSTDNGVILSKRSVKVHPAVAELIAPVFEVQKADNLGWKIYDNINGTLKQVQLGFSGFHGFALTESSIGNSYLRNTLKHLNPKKFVDAILNDDYDIFKQEKIAKDGIEHGLKLGTPSDLNRSNVEKFLSNIPIIGKLTEANNKILWDCLHNSFKIEAYKMKCDEVGGNITTEQKRAIAQWVNDSFGGQAWELLGVKNSTVKGLSRALLSPDWLISTTRQFMGMAENVPVSKWLEKCDIKALKKFAKISGVSDIGDNLGVRGKSARKFWVTAMVFSVLFYNLINAMFRAKDRKEHPEYYSDNTLMSYTIWDNALPGDKLSTKIMPYIFIGRNKDGSARYLRLGKQFREVPEMLSEPVSKLSMKSATVPSALANVGLGYSIGDVPKKLAGKDTDVYYNQEIWNGYGKFAKKKQGAELYKGMGKTALKSVAPFIVNNAMNEHHNFSGWDVFAQTSNGLGYTKAKKQYLYAYEHGNNPKDFEKITRKGIQDGMSYRKLKSAKKKAESEYKQNIVNEYAEQYVEALKQQNQSKINKVSDKLEKENVPAKIRTKVYKEALKEYRKSVK